MRFIHILILIQLFSCSREGNQELTTKRIAVIDIVTIGSGQEQATNEALLGYPSHVASDPDGNIHVLDRATMQLKKYSPEGGFIGVYFSEGRGPNEFKNFSSLYIDKYGRGLIYDRMNRRITRYDGQFNTIDQWNFNALTDVRVFPRSDSVVDIVNYDTFVDETVWSEYILKQYNLINQEVIGGILDPGKVFDEDDSILAHSMSARIGSVYWDESSLLYAPSVFGGQIFSILDHDVEIIGDPFDFPRYQEVENPTVQNSNFVINYAGEKLGATLPVQSRGIFRMSNGHIAHFIVADSNTGGFFGVELYSSSGTKLGTYVIDELPIVPDRVQGTSRSVAWIDEDDQFYLIDRDDIPVIRVFKLGEVL